MGQLEKGKIISALAVIFLEFVMAGCIKNSPLPVNDPTLPQPTITPLASPQLWKATSSVTPLQTSTLVPPTKNEIHLSSDTPSPVLTQTTGFSADKRATVQTLTDVMLSRDDYQAFNDRHFSYLASEIFEIYFKEGAATITDNSTELNPICLLECTKQVWATASETVTGYGGEQVTINRKVVIAMLRSKDEIGAQKTALNLYNEFLPFDYEYGDEYKNVNAPKENTRIGLDLANDRLAGILTTSVGSITIWVMNYPHQLADDGATEVDIATYFANLQIMKLKNAGLVP